MSEDHKEIWLQPWCDGCDRCSRDDGRQWCLDDVWGKCDECGSASVRYVIAPSVSTPSRAGSEKLWQQEAEQLKLALDAMSERAGKASRMIEALEAERNSAREMLVEADEAAEGIDHFAWSMVSLPIDARTNLQNKIDYLRKFRARVAALLAPK